MKSEIKVIILAFFFLLYSDGIALCQTNELLSFAKVMKPGHGTVAMGRGGFSLPNQGD